MSKSISILGCGWLGLPLAQHFVQRGYAVKGSTTQTEKLTLLEGKGVTAYLIDLSKAIDERLINDFLQSEVLIILLPPRSRTQAPGVYLAQIKQVLPIIEASSKIQHVIYSSSTSVYPDKPGLAKESSVKTIEESAHAELLEVEQALQQLSKEVAIVRFGGLTGGSRLLIKHFAGKKELQGGNNPVNLIHLEDAIGVVDLCVERELAGTVNACSPEHPLKKDFYTALAERYGLEAPEFVQTRGVGKIVDVSKLEMLGYRFVFPDPYGFTYTV